MLVKGATDDQGEASINWIQINENLNLDQLNGSQGLIPQTYLHHNTVIETPF